MKSLEDTIRELQKRNKNKPSPLSEQYRRGEGSVNFIPQTTQNKLNRDPRDLLIGDFKPLPKGF